MICLTGTIVHGQGKGTAAGFPTANLCCNANVQLPQAGVYATRVHLDGHVYAGVTNIGTRPTADSSQQITIETLILDFSGDIYGDGMTLDVIGYIRGIHKFESMAALHAQIQRDAQTARTMLEKMPRI